MVTAEIAVAIPGLMVFLAAALTMISVVSAQLRCTDAAREAARALARGDSRTAAESLAVQAISGATLSASNAGQEIRVRIRADVHGLAGVLPAITVSASAVAEREPDGS